MDRPVRHPGRRATIPLAVVSIINKNHYYPWASFKDMNAQAISRHIFPVAFVTLLLGSSVATAQPGQPEWADDFFAELDDWVTEYNEHVNTEGVEFPGDLLLKNERVNMYVAAADGTEAVYSFRTDGEMRILDLQQRAREDETVQVKTTRVVLERVVAEADPATAVTDAVLAGEIRVKRLVTVFGWTTAIGVTETAIGVAAIVASAVVTKVGMSSLLSSLKLLGSEVSSTGQLFVRPLLRILGVLKAHLSDLVAALTALEILGVDVKTRIHRLWRRLTAPFVWLMNQFRKPSSEERDLSRRDKE